MWVDSEIPPPLSRESVDGGALDQKNRVESTVRRMTVTLCDVVAPGTV